jgi:hypothetical protein
VAGEKVTGRDLVAAGAVSGRWLKLEDEIVRALALSNSASASDGDLTAAMRDFRYERHLTSAEDFRAWLDQRELTVADVRSAVERDLLRRRYGPAENPGAVETRRVLAALPAEAVYSGALEDSGVWLADRLLCAKGADSRGPGVSNECLEAVAAAEARLVAVSVLDEPEDVRVARLEWVLAADAAFVARAAAVATPEALAACVEEHRLDWVEFELDGFRCSSRSAAAESMMLLREDSLAVEEVARLAGVHAVRQALRRESAPAALAAALAGAAVGDVIGPFADGEGYALWRVVARVLPDVGNPGVRERATAKLLAADASRRRAGRVTWFDRT